MSRHIRVRMSGAGWAAGLLLLGLAGRLPASGQTPIELHAGDAAVGDSFGNAVAVDGGVAVVGAKLDNEGPYGYETGSAYVYRFNGSTWVQEQELLDSDGLDGALFGYSVAIDGGVIVVGAPHAGSAPNPTWSGAAYVFRYNVGTSTWAQEQKLLASDPAQNALFGRSVAIDGDRIIGGADWYSNSTGAAYIYEYNASLSQWQFKKKLTAHDGQQQDSYGYAVAIQGDYALVGCPRDDDRGADSGSVYIYNWGGTVWSYWGKLTASDGAAGDHFGWSLSMNGDLLAIGAEMDDFDADGYPEGSAYVFRYSPAHTTWLQEQKLTGASVGAHPPPERYYRFGATVGACGNTIVVGAPREWCTLREAGAAYVFRHDGALWYEDVRLLEPDQGVDNFFGEGVATSAGYVVVGSPGDDDLGEYSGSAYVYDVYVLPGDLNCDGVVNFADINPFVLALSGQAAYEAAYPNCRWLNADCNGDGQVNFADINPFVAVLGGG